MPTTDSLASATLTVPAILTGIYGKPKKALAALQVTRSSLSNWRAWGYFPERMVGRLLRDADAAGFKLTAQQIPTMTNMPGSQ